MMMLEFRNLLALNVKKKDKSKTVMERIRAAWTDVLMDFCIFYLYVDKSHSGERKRGNLDGWMGGWMH